MVIGMNLLKKPSPSETVWPKKQKLHRTVRRRHHWSRAGCPATSLETGNQWNRSKAVRGLFLRGIDSRGVPFGHLHLGDDKKYGQPSQGWFGANIGGERMLRVRLAPQLLGKSWKCG
jgi:hypothetical protein